MKFFENVSLYFHMRMNKSSLNNYNNSGNIEIYYKCLNEKELLYKFKIL